MSYRQLLRTTIKRTDERIDKVPKWYYWIIGGIVLPTVISLSSYLLSPFLPTFTFIQLVVSMFFFAAALSPVLVMTSFTSILSYLFISILREERRKEEEKQDKAVLQEIKDTVKETLPEILDKNDIATNTAIKGALDLANRSYQELKELTIKQQEEIEKLKTKDAQTEERLGAVENEQQRHLERLNKQDSQIRIKDLVIDKLRKEKNLAEWKLDQAKKEPHEESQKKLGKLKRNAKISKWWEKITRYSKDHK